MRRKPAFELSAEERRIEAELDRGEWNLKPVKAGDPYAAQLVAAAKRTLKGARVNLRLNPGDVALIRRQALREGMPYQTLIASVLHKYATGQLVDETTMHRIVDRALRKGSSRRKAAS